MPYPTPATRALDRLAIPYRIYRHTRPPESLEQATNERGQVPTQVIRSILFRFNKDQFFLTLIAGPGQISWRKLRRFLGVGRISLATENEVLVVTGYVVGTVSPFGLLRAVKILADESIFKPEEVSLGSGVPGVAIIMKSTDLKVALGEFEPGQFC
jgi:Cys-tRNA(Pro)/Cys-tRNA(Cys) deacylase